MRISDWSSDVCSSDLNDTVARLSGDEFTLVLEDISDLATVERKAQIIIDSFTASLDIDDQRDVIISPSIGISLYPDHGLVPTDLLKCADTAMYQAKASGRNTLDRKSVVEGRSVSVRLDHGCRRIIKKKNKKIK